MEILINALIVIFAIVGTGLFMWILTWFLISLLEYMHEGSVDDSAEWSIYKKIRNAYRTIIKHIKLKPRTPTQKKIADELKDIKILEQQKADMKELERLKARRRELFQEVNNKEDE